MNLVAEAERIADDSRRPRRRRRAAPASRRGVEATARRSAFCASLQPRRWGGGEVHILEFVDAVIALSTRQPVGRLGRGRHRCAPVAARAVRRSRPAGDVGRRPDHDALLVVQPDRQGRAVDGGYKVWGRWSFSSGLRPLPRREPRRDRAPAATSRSSARSCCSRPVPHRGQLARRRSQGTGSKDIVVEETFVPEYRTQSHLDYAARRAAARQERNDGPLYRLPWSVVFNMALAASVLGAARGSSTTWIERDDRRGRRPGAGRTRRRPAHAAPARRRDVGPRRRRRRAARRHADDVGHGRGARDPHDGRPRPHAVEHEPRLSSASRDARRRTVPRRVGSNDLRRPSAPVAVPGSAGRARSRLPRPRPARQGGRRRAARHRPSPSSCCDRDR